MTDNSDERAIATALADLTTYAQTRMTGSRADMNAWLDQVRAAPSEIIAALLRAGYVVRPIGGAPTTRVTVAKGHTPIHRLIRVEADIPADCTLWSEVDVDVRQASDPTFLEHVARAASAKMARVVEIQIAERITGPIVRHDYFPAHD